MSTPRLIAFYLPQYHPIPENDIWWGKGFTEWTNVVRARPLFKGHYQPHIPADLGFYDLRLSETREAQAELAKEYGIHGFCYYHYWFQGRRLLERPFNEVLESGKPDFPFCLCWANENWTRNWDGRDKEILLPQHYDLEDDRAHIRTLFPAFDDKRYIRVDKKPFFLVYRSELFPNIKESTDIWREEALKAGFGDIFLANVQSVGTYSDPHKIGFDASVEFAPDWNNHGPKIISNRLAALWHKLTGNDKLKPKIYSYDNLMNKMLLKSSPQYRLFRCVTPSWDNTPRKKQEMTIIAGSTPEKYEMWLKKIIQKTSESSSSEENIVFINAWNEWAEGCHLEPDQKFGLKYLEATQRAIIKS